LIETKDPVVVDDVVLSKRSKHLRKLAAYLADKYTTDETINKTQDLCNTIAKESG